MKNIIIGLLVALLLIVAPSRVSAEGDTPCEYNKVITGCIRNVFVVDVLPGNVGTFPAVVGANTATCAHVGAHQTWCQVNDTPAVPVTPTTKLPVHVCAQGLTPFWVDGQAVCATATPLVQPAIGFTG